MTPSRPSFIADAGRHVLRVLLVGLLSTASPSMMSSAHAGMSEAEVLIRKGRIEEGLQAAAQQAVLAPNDMDAHELYIDLLLNLGFFDQARGTYAKRVQLNPLDANAHYLLGRATVDARGARDAFEKALRIDPSHARSHMGMGAIHSALDQPVDSEAAYGRATAMDPTLIEAWLGRIRGRLAASDVPGAVRLAEEALATNPDDPSIVFTLVTIAPTKAEALLPKAIAATPDDAPLREAWAEHLLASGQTDEALEAARAALAVDPTRERARLVLWTAEELHDGRLSRAQATRLQAARAAGDIAELNAVVTDAPRSVLAHLARATVRAQTDAASALPDLKAAWELAPSHTEACAAYGKALLVAKRASDAIAPLTCAADVRDWDVPLQIARAQAEVAGGQAQQGVPRLHALAEARPSDVVVIGAYAQALVDTGQADKAYNLVKRAMATNPDPRLGAAFVVVAVEAGHRTEAADFLDTLAERSGSDALREKAQTLRANP